VRQRLGQHFLRDARAAARIVSALDPPAFATVLEIGPGHGALTVHLVDRCAHLVLVERDTALVRELDRRWGARSHVHLVEGDAARVNLCMILPSGGGVFAVSNLPYEAATAILMNLLRHRRLFSRLVLMFQAEVARRIAARPRTREYSALSAIVQAHCIVESLFRVAPHQFEPPPDVQSRVLRLTPRPSDDPIARAAEDPSFADLAHALHAQPRKTVLNSLGVGLRRPRTSVQALLAEARIDPLVRPSDVSLEQVVTLWRVWRGIPDGHPPRDA